MKVVIFCGGQGLRLRDYSESVPKPMVPVGYRPIVWHLMKYYAHYGYKDFVLALGWKADAIKDYFLNYNEAVSNDFVLTGGGPGGGISGRNLRLLNSDIHDWRITFVDTGIESCIGQRLCLVREHLGDDEHFLCNYADCLTDAPIPDMVEHLRRQPGKLMSFISVRPSNSFHVVSHHADGSLKSVRSSLETDLFINGGYWVCHRDIFDYIKFGEEIVNEPMARLIAADKLTTYRYEGFWACMDTFKEKMLLDDMLARGKAPWLKWKKPAPVMPSAKLA